MVFPNFIESFRISFSPGAFVASVLLLLLYNIPTVVLLLICAWRRKKKNAASRLNKMNVQDL